MKRAILTTFFLACTSNAISQPLELPRALSNGNVADADEVMANFNALKDGVNTRMSVDLTTYNTAIGNGLKSVTPGTPDASSGTLNTASGIGALYSNTSGYLNTAVGLNGLYTNSAGGFNSAFGNGALYLNEDGSYNTAIGSRAAYSNTSGSYLVAVGREALFNNTTGDFNTVIGYAADVTTGGITNATAIGYNAKVNDSNKVRIGNTSVTVIEGQVAFSASSDARLKENITVVDAGLALVNDLNPVSYHRINSSSDDIEMGLLAQEVEEVLAAHGLSNSGMVHQASEDAYRSVRYNDLFAPMIRAIQELDSQHAADVTKKEEQIALLKSQLIDQSQQLKSQQEELLAVVKSQQEQMAVQQEQMAMQQEQMTMQQEQIAQLQRTVEHQFASK